MTVARALLLTIFMLLAACGAQAPAGPANAGPAKAPIPTPAEVHGPLVSTLAGKAGPVFVRFLANAHSGTVDDVEVVTADVTCSDRHAREDEVHLGFHATAGPSGPIELNGRIGREKATGWIAFRSLDVSPGGKVQGSMFARGDGIAASTVRGEFEGIVCMQRFGVLTKTANLVAEIDGVETKLAYVDLANPRELTFAEAVTPEGRTNRDGFLSVYVTLGDTPGGEFFDGSAFAPDIEVRLKTGQYMPVKGQLEMGQLRLAEYATVHGKLTIEKQESSRALPKTSIALRGTFDAQLPEDEDGGYAWLTSRTSPPSTALVATIGDRTENVATRVNRAGKVEIVRGKNACASTDVIMSWTPAVQASIPTSATFETTRPLALLHGWTTPTDATGFRGSLFVTSDFFDHKQRTDPQTLASLQPTLRDDYLIAGPYDAVKCP